MNLSSLSASFLPLKAKHQWYSFLNPRDVLFGHWLFAPRSTRMICWLEFFGAIFGLQCFIHDLRVGLIKPLPSEIIGWGKGHGGDFKCHSKMIFLFSFKIYTWFALPPGTRRLAHRHPPQQGLPTRHAHAGSYVRAASPGRHLDVRDDDSSTPQTLSPHSPWLSLFYIFLPLPWSYRFTQKTLVGHL